jgi:1,4-alpha-glucan branching enzyme
LIKTVSKACKGARQGYLALVLHAHLPFVRHPEYNEALEENWLFECITETYMPLLLMMDRLVSTRTDFRLTMSLTPTLVAMLDDPLLRYRYARRLTRLIELSAKEITRTKRYPRLNLLAKTYRRRLVETRDAFIEKYRLDITSAFAAMQKTGRLEILASAATHAFLPLLSDDPASVKAQIKIGIDNYRRSFGCKPRGFWLPECAYYPGLDKLLKAAGISYTILETHGITHAEPVPECGIFTPVTCQSGLVVFGRDPDSSKQVWSASEGYPGDYNYREFYRDIAHDLDHSYIAPYIHPAGIRMDTGFKYYRITGKTENKKHYCLKTAEKIASRHAADFIHKKLCKIDELRPYMSRKPLFVAPFDAELFGHWWYEGPVWIGELIRKMALVKKKLKLVTLSEYLDEYPDNQTVSPSMSSWGDRGYNNRWLNPGNDWIYKHLRHASGTVKDIAVRHKEGKGLVRRALNQACRELLLAQASDWAFMIEGGRTAQYATKRLKTHLIRIDRLSKQIDSGQIDKQWLEALEKQDNLFRPINYRAWA